MLAAALAPSSLPAPDQRRPRLTVVRGADRGTGTIRVVVADGRALSRAGVRALLEREPGIAVVGEAATGDEAVALARRTRPQVMLVDVRLPGLDHPRAIWRLLAEPGVAVMLLACDVDERVVGALRAGARGLLPQDAGPAELVRAVRILARGATALAPVVPTRLVADEPAERTGALIQFPGRRGSARRRLAAGHRAGSPPRASAH